MTSLHHNRSHCNFSAKVNSKCLCFFFLVMKVQCDYVETWYSSLLNLILFCSQHWAQFEIHFQHSVSLPIGPKVQKTLCGCILHGTHCVVLCFLWNGKFTFCDILNSSITVSQVVSKLMHLQTFIKKMKLVTIIMNSKMWLMAWCSLTVWSMKW